MSKHTPKALELLSEKLKVNQYYKKHKSRSTTWLLFGMLCKWQACLNTEDESPKKVLARHLVACEKEWEDDDDFFSRLAIKIDLQGNVF